jgi:hypothetical protein
MSIYDGMGLIVWEGGLFEPGSDLLRRVQWAFAQIRAAGGTIYLNEAGRPFGVPSDANARTESQTASGRSTVWFQWGRYLRGETPSAANPALGPNASEHTQGKAVDTNAPTDNDMALRKKFFGMVGMIQTISSESWHFAIRSNPTVDLAGVGDSTPIINNAPTMEDEEDMKLVWDTGGTGWLILGPCWVGLPSMQIRNLFKRVIISNQSSDRPDTFLRAEVDMMNAIQVSGYQGIIRGAISIPTLDTTKLADAVVTALSTKGIQTTVSADDPNLAKALDAGFVRSMTAYAKAAGSESAKSFDPQLLANSVAQSLQKSGIVANIDTKPVEDAVKSAIDRATAAIGRALATPTTA